MDLFLFLVVTILLTVFFVSILSPPPAEHDDDDDLLHEFPSDSAELRFESLFHGLLDPRSELQERYRTQILAMGPAVIPRIVGMLSKAVFLDQLRPEYTQHAKELLQDFGLRSIPPLLDWLSSKGEEPKVADTVQEILAAMGTSAVPFLVERYRPELAPYLKPVLHRLGEPAIQEILLAFRLSPHRSEWSPLILGFGEPVVAGLKKAVETWTGDAQIKAFHLFARFAPTSDLDLFASFLSHPQPQLQIDAIQALATIADPRCLPSLLPMLESPRASVRTAAMKVLGQLADPQAIPSLQAAASQALERDDLTEVAALHVALAKLGEAVPKDLLDTLKDHPRHAVRNLLFDLFPFLPSEQRFSLCSSLLRDAHGPTLKRAIQEARTIKTSSTARLLLDRVIKEEDETILLWLERALLELGEIATAPLLRLLQDDDPALQSTAFRFLSKGSDLQAFDPLFAYIRRSWRAEPSSNSSLSEALETYLRHLLRDQAAPTLSTVQRYLEEFPDPPSSSLLREILARATPPPPPASSLAVDPKTTA